MAYEHLPTRHELQAETLPVEMSDESTIEARNSQSPPEAPGSLSVAELMQRSEIDTAAASELANQARGQIEAALHKAETYGQFTPAIASVIAHSNDSETPPLYPTAAEIKQQSRGARIVSGFLGFFSARWAKRFDSYLERKAAQKLNYIARHTSENLNAIGRIAKPKQQFLAELTTAYQSSLQHPSLQEGLLQTIHNIMNNQSEDADRTESRPYTLLSRLSGLGKLQGRTSRAEVRAAAPEIMRGIEQFLKKQHVEVGHAQSNEKPTITRRLATRFKPAVLSELPGQIETMLTSIYNVLPGDGRQFRDGVYAICKDIATRSRQGESGEALTRKLLQQVRELLR